MDTIDDREIQEKVESMAGKGTKVLDCEKSSSFQTEEVLMVNGLKVELKGEQGKRIKQALMSGTVPPCDLLNDILIRAGILKNPVELETTIETKSTTKTTELMVLRDKHGFLVDERMKEVEEDNEIKSSSHEVWKRDEADQASLPAAALNAKSNGKLMNLSPSSYTPSTSSPASTSSSSHSPSPHPPYTSSSSSASTANNNQNSFGMISKKFDRMRLGGGGIRASSTPSNANTNLNPNLNSKPPSTQANNMRYSPISSQSYSEEGASSSSFASNSSAASSSSTSSRFSVSSCINKLKFNKNKENKKNLISSGSSMSKSKKELGGNRVNEPESDGTNSPRVISNKNKNKNLKDDRKTGSESKNKNTKEIESVLVNSGRSYNYNNTNTKNSVELLNDPSIFQVTMNGNPIRVSIETFV